MSSVDQRIVEMQFDNKQFEQGVAGSLKTLEALKKGLDLDKSARSLEKLQEAGKKFSLDGLAKNVEFVASKFTMLGIVGVNIMNQIANAAIATGKNLLSSLTVDPARSGLREYETQLNSIQTILSNTRSKGTGLDDVNRALDELNAYSDKTIYNFTEMAKNIGTFTAAGLDLDVSTNAIKGIANLAAVSGSNAQQASVAMYQLSQALASGTIRLMDWNSVVNAGMGGEVFQNALKETARLHGVAIDAMIKKEGSFRETLQNGWLTSAILTETLSKFTGDLSKEEIKAMGYTEQQAEEIIALGKDASDAATKVKTFTQLIDTLKEALGSGWAQTWENIIGNFEEARDLWTSLSDTLGGLINQNAKARNELLAKWKELGGRDDLLKGLTDMFGALRNVVVAVGDAMHDIFPEVTLDNLLAISKGVKDFGHNLKILLSATDHITESKTIFESKLLGGTTDGLKKGDAGEKVKDLQKRLTEAGYTLEQDGIFGKKTEAALKKFREQHSTLVDTIFGGDTQKALFGSEIVSITKLTTAVTYFSEKLDLLRRISSGAFAVVDIGIKAFKFLWDVVLAVGDTLSPIADMFLEIAAALGDWLVGVDDGMKSLDPFADWLQRVQDFLKPFKAVLQGATKGFLSFFGIGAKAETASGQVKTFADVIREVKEFLFGTEGDTMGFTGKKIGLIQRIADFFSGISIWYSKTEVAQAFVTKVKDIVKTIKEFIFGTEGDTMGFSSGKSNVIQKLGDFFEGLSAWYSSSDAAQAFVQKVKEIAQDIKEFIFGTEGDTMGFSSGKPSIVERIGNFFTNLSKWYSTSETAQSFVKSVKEIMRDVKEFIFGTEGDTMGFTNGKPTIIERISEFFAQLSAWYASSGIAQKFVENVKKIVQDIKGFIFGTEGDTMGFTSGKPGVIQRVTAFFKELSDWYSKSETAHRVVAKVKKFLGDFWEFIKSFFVGIEAKAETKPGSAGETVKSMVKFSDGFGSGFEKVMAVLEKAFDIANTFFNNTGVGGILALVVAGMGIKGVFSFGKVLKALVVGIGDAVGAFKTLLGGTNEILGLFKENFKNRQKIQPTSKSLLQIAAAIGILVGAIYLLGTMDPEDLIRGTVYLAGIIAVLVMLSTVLSGIAKADQGASLEKAGKAILHLTIAIGIVAVAMWLLGSMDQTVLKNGAGVVIGILVLLGVFLAFMQSFGSVEANYKGLVGVAFAIGILGLIAWMLGKMDQASLLRGTEALGAIMLLLALFMAGVNNIGGPTDIKYKGIFAMVLAVGVMAGLVVLLSKVDWNKGWQGMLALMVLMAALGKFMTYVNEKIGNSQVKYGGLLAMAVSIGILAGVAILLGGMDAGAMWRGIAGVTAMMAALGGMMALIGTTSKNVTGKTIAETAVLILAFGALMVVFGTVINSIKNVDPNAMLAFATSFTIAFGALIGVLLLVGNKKVGGVGIMAKGATGIGTAITILIAFAVAIVSALGGINQLTGEGFITTLKNGGQVLKTLGQAIGLLVSGIREGIAGKSDAESTTTDLENYNVALGNLSDAIDGFKEVLVGLFVAIMFAGAIGEGLTAIKGAFGLGVALLELATAIALIVWGLGYINILSEGNFVKTLEDGGKVMESLGKALGAFVKGVKDGFTGGEKKTELESYTDNVKNYSDALTSLTTSVQAMSGSTEIQTDIDRSIELTKKLKAYFDTMELYPLNYSPVEGYETAPSEVATDMKKFGEGITEFVDAVKNLGNPIALYLSTLKALGLAAILYNFFSNMKGYKIDRTGIDQYQSAPGVFATDLTAFSGAISDFKTKVAGLGTDTEIQADTDMAISIATKVQDFFLNIGSKLPDGLGIRQYNTGLRSLFGSMDSFAETMSSFQDKLNKISQTTIIADTAAALLSAWAVAGFLAAIPDLGVDASKGPIVSWFAGKSSTDTVIDQLATLGNSMKTLKSGIEGFAKSTIVSDTETMKLAMQAIVGLLVWISSNGGSLSGYAPENGNFDIFTAAMNQLGELQGAISSFDVATKEVDTTKMTAISTAFSSMVQALVSLADLMSGTGKTKLDSSHFLDGLKIEDIDKGMTDFVTKATQTIANGEDSMRQSVDAFNSTGSSLATGMNTGFADGADTSVVTTMATNLLTAIGNYKGQFYIAGYNLGKGMSNGLKDSKVLAVLAAKEVADAVIAKIRAVFNENSPSKETEEIGMYADMGLANGLSTYGRLVTRAAGDVGSGALDTTRSILSNLSTLLIDGMESDPVIRPVVDLSNVASGARAISGMLGGQQYLSVNNSRTKALASSVAPMGVAKVQNGSASGTNPAASVTKLFSFEGANFTFRDKIDFRMFKLELDGLARDDDRALGSVH